jgi:outer membrane protein
MKNNVVCSLLFTVFAANLGSQTPLSLNEALDSALQNRLGLVMARNDAEAARLLNTPGQAGMLPLISLNAGFAGSGNSIDQQFSNGTVIRRDGVRVNTSNAALAGSWTLFDGMRMFAVRDRLAALQAMGEQGVYAETVRISTTTRLAFHAAAREQAVLGYMRKQLELSEALAVLAAQRVEAGAAAAVEAMRVRTTAEAWQAQVSQQIGRLNEARELLAFEMAVPSTNLPSSIFQDTLLPPTTSPDAWISRLNSNPDLQLAAINLEISAAQVREWEAQRWPQLRANAGYNYNTNRNSDGFFLVNQSYGLNGGLTLSWNLFNGGMVRNQLKVAGIQRDNATLTRIELQRQLESAIRQAWIRLETARRVYGQTATALATAVLASEVTEARYRAGAAVLLELNEVLRNENDLQLALADALLRIRIAETELDALTGEAR